MIDVFVDKAFDSSPDEYATILANISLCALRAGNGKAALSYATMCRMGRPLWPKACYREGAALMLLKVKRTQYSFLQASVIMTV